MQQAIPKITQATETQDMLLTSNVELSETAAAQIHKSQTGKKKQNKEEKTINVLSNSANFPDKKKKNNIFWT